VSGGGSLQPIEAAGRNPRFAVQTGTLEPLVGPAWQNQMAMARTLGYRRFCDPGWLDRRPLEQAAFIAEAQQSGLTLGPVRSRYVGGDAAAQQAWMEQLPSLCEHLSAHQIHGLRVELGPPQWRAAGSDALAQWSLETWRSLAEVAAQSGVTLLLEPWDDGRSGPQPLDQACHIVRHVGHLALGISWNEPHWHTHGVNLRPMHRSQPANVTQFVLTLGVPSHQLPQSPDAGEETDWCCLTSLAKPPTDGA
jgi:hypothetical protein